AQLKPDGFDWQVPGLRGELIAGLLRALPKAIRRSVVPAADWAARFADELAGDGPESHDGLPPRPLREALAARVQRVSNQPVTAADFDLDRVPGHLWVSFRAVDERGRTVASDRDLRALQDRLADRARGAVTKSLAAPRGDRPPRPGAAGSAPGAVPGLDPAGASGVAGAGAAGAGVAEQTGLVDWTIGDLPALVDTRVAGGVVRGYPSLVDEGASVALRIQATPEAAERLTHAGVRRLLLLTVPSPSPYVLEHLTAHEKLALAASPYPSAKALIEDARVAVADAVLARTMPGAVVRTPADFTRVRAEFSRVVVDELFQTVSLTARILTAARDVEKAVRAQNSMTLLAALGDIKGQLAGLVFPGFVSRIGIARLAHLPRYLAGAAERVAQLGDNPGRDRQRLTEYERMAALYTEAGGTIPLAEDAPPNLAHVRWLLEEYRVSLFAQRLGTAEPVSPQRIQKALRG
ncbi:DUF3418 domain-containing protein, partial [Microbacterium sp. zg.Y909]|uniref:DUF3418 domain-containing protein n=1 Tax=Microbacterium sp. zg.Y909 TaxID=2969413 RepID=UPI00214CCD89